MKQGHAVLAYVAHLCVHSYTYVHSQPVNPNLSSAAFLSPFKIMSVAMVLGFSSLVFVPYISLKSWIP